MVRIGSRASHPATLCTASPEPQLDDRDGISLWDRGFLTACEVCSDRFCFRLMLTHEHGGAEETVQRSKFDLTDQLQLAPGDVRLACNDIFDTLVKFKTGRSQIASLVSRHSHSIGPPVTHLSDTATCPLQCHRLCRRRVDELSQLLILRLLSLPL